MYHCASILKGPLSCCNYLCHVTTFILIEYLFVLVPDTKKKPMARALYDFIAENEGELAFQEGDYIDLISQVSCCVAPYNKIIVVYVTWGN